MPSATVLARIHAFSAARPQLAAEFATDAIFFDIRLEPYLLATAARHPDLAPRIEALVKTTQANTVALVHGDVSPKNILVGAEGPVLIDAECAWWGDPAFDIAFCLNHLLLKCLWNRARHRGLPRQLRGLVAGLSGRRRLGAGRGDSSSARRRCCPASSWRGSTASRRSNTSPTRPTANGCAASAAV